MDAADRALIQIEREAELRDKARKAAPAPSASALLCRDCDEPIELARREAVPGCQRCADCAQDYARYLRR